MAKGQNSASQNRTSDDRSRGRSHLLEAVFELKSAWWAVLFFSLVINALQLAPTIYMMQISERVMAAKSYTTLIMLTILIVLVLAMMGALEWARTRILVSVGARLDNNLGIRLLAESHRLQIDDAGDGGRLLGDLMRVRTFITGFGILAALDAPWIPIFAVACWILHPTLAIMVTSGSLLMLLLTYLTERFTHAPLEKANNSAADASRFAAVNMRHGEVIEAMGMFPAMAEKWQQKQERHVLEQARASDRAGMLSGASKFVRMTNQTVAMGVGGLLFLNGEVSPGIIFAASLLSSRMTGPIDALLATWSQWSTVMESWNRLEEALAGTPKTYSGVSLPAPKGEVTLEGVYGAPPGVKSPFIQNVSLKIPAGASVAIVGSSASGKSSLLRLISGIWAPRMGTVRIDGADLRTWPRNELGPYIGYLPQDVDLIEGTVAENIARLGVVDSDKILDAARAAGVHEMILELKDGYGSQVGANGSFLSGGQRQRIALARAMYGNPPLLILDEPNANLDEAGEVALDKALQEARKRGQTALIVSHRPIAIRNCDLIIVMQAGQVSLYGPRNQVLAKLAEASGQKNGNGSNPQSAKENGSKAPPAALSQMSQQPLPAAPAT